MNADQTVQWSWPNDPGHWEHLCIPAQDDQIPDIFKDIPLPKQSGSSVADIAARNKRIADAKKLKDVQKQSDPPYVVKDWPI